MQKQSKQAKKGQNLAFSILKSTPPQKKYTTVGCGGCDKYELLDRVWMKKNLIEVIHEVKSQSGNDEQEEPIIHGFKDTASQYQSEKKIPSNSQKIVDLEALLKTLFLF